MHFAVYRGLEDTLNPLSNVIEQREVHNSHLIHFRLAIFLPNSRRRMLEVFILGHYKGILWTVLNVNFSSHKNSRNYDHQVGRNFCNY